MSGLATFGFHMFSLAQILDHLSPIYKSNILVKHEQIFIKNDDYFWRQMPTSADGWRQKFLLFARQYRAAANISKISPHKIGWRQLF